MDVLGGRQSPLGKFDQIVVQTVFHLVQRGLCLGQLFQRLGVIIVQKPDGDAVILKGVVPHADDHLVGPLQRQRGGGEEPLVQSGHILQLSFAGDQRFHQLYQLLAEGEEQSGTGQVENQVEVGHAAHVDGAIPKGEMEDGIAGIQKDQEEDRTHHIEEKVDKGGPLGVLAGPRAGEEGGDGGADVLAHDKGHGGVEPHRSGGGQSL